MWGRVLAHNRSSGKEEGGRGKMRKERVEEDRKWGKKKGWQWGRGKKMQEEGVNNPNNLHALLTIFFD